MEVSKRALEAMMAKQANTNVAHHHYPAPSSPPPSRAVENATSPAKKKASELSAYKEQLSELMLMRNMLPDNMHGQLNECISKVTSKVHGFVCLDAEDLTE